MSPAGTDTFAAPSPNAEEVVMRIPKLIRTALIAGLTLLPVGTLSAHDFVYVRHGEYVRYYRPHYRSYVYGGYYAPTYAYPYYYAPPRVVYRPVYPRYRYYAPRPHWGVGVYVGR